MDRARKAEGGHVNFFCPGCNEVHGINTTRWTWNQDLEAPTFSPSLLVGGVQWAAEDPFYKPEHSQVPAGGSIVCHSFVTDGRIQFLSDSTHALSDQTVELPPWPYGKEV